MIIVCYDVNTQTKIGRGRLRKVATACKDHGARVQFSVFECAIDDAEWLRLRAEILSIINPDEDSVRFYFIDDRSAKNTEHHGVRQPLDLKGPLVL